MTVVSLDRILLRGILDIEIAGFVDFCHEVLGAVLTQFVQVLLHPFGLFLRGKGHLKRLNLILCCL